LPIFITQARKSCEPEKWDPRTRETADHSLPYIFARALVDGPIRMSSFEDEAVRDPALRPIMAKIKSDSGRCHRGDVAGKNFAARGGDDP
jgi:2-methylcitrate dehydratase PrpD